MDNQPVQVLKSKWETVKSLNWGRYIVYTLIGVGAVVGLIWAKKIWWPVAPVNTAPQVLAEAPKAANVERIYIPGPTKIMVYDRQSLLNEIPVPPAVSGNPNNQFTATAVVPPSPNGGVAVSFINRSSGQSGISYQAKPRPLFGWGGDGCVSLRGGMGAGNSSNGYTGCVAVRQKIIRISDVQISGIGELNISTYQKPEARAMVDAEIFSWK